MSWSPSHTTYPPAYLAEDISGRLQATCITFLILEFIFICLMWISRWCAKKERTNAAIEVFMTATWVVCCAKITVALLMIHIGGTGHHTASLTPSQSSSSLKLATATQIICPMTTSFSKLGVLIFLDRILRQSGRAYRVAIRTTFALVTITVIAQVLIPFVNCRPFRKTWLPQTPGTCSIQILSLYRYAGLPNVFTTLLVVGIPVPALSGLHVSRAVKLGLVVVFAMCVAGIVAAFMRTYAYLMVRNFSDITYENVRPMCWIVAESGIYLIAGVTLTLRPLVRRACRGTGVERYFEGSGGSRSWGSRRVSRGVGRGWWRQRDGVVGRVDVVEEKDKGSENGEGERRERVEDGSGKFGYHAV